MVKGDSHTGGCFFSKWLSLDHSDEVVVVL